MIKSITSETQDEVRRIARGLVPLGHAIAVAFRVGFVEMRGMEMIDEETPHVTPLEEIWEIEGYEQHYYTDCEITLRVSADDMMIAEDRLDWFKDRLGEMAEWEGIDWSVGIEAEA